MRNTAYGVFIMISKIFPATRSFLAKNMPGSILNNLAYRIRKKNIPGTAIPAAIMFQSPFYSKLGINPIFVRQSNYTNFFSRMMAGRKKYFLVERLLSSMKTTFKSQKVDAYNRW